MTDLEIESRWLRETVGVRRLDEVALLRVYDDDRRSWLNGQITNDVSSLQPGGAVYALTVDLKGKILADLWVLDRGDELVLIVPSDARERLFAHYDRYIVMEDVELEPLDDRVVLTAQGPSWAAVADALDQRIERAPCDRLWSGGVDVLVTADEADEVLARMTEAAARAHGGAVSQEGWERARVKGGVPRFGHDFGDNTLPQEAGLADRAVSFLKGCYLGQEVVCMLENRGKLRRRLVTLEADVPLLPGAALALDGPSLGEVTSSSWDGVRTHAIAKLKAKAASPGTVLQVAGGSAQVAGVVGEATLGSGGSEGRNL